MGQLAALTRSAACVGDGEFEPAGPIAVHVLAAATAIGAVLLAALHSIHGQDYWNYSEGVYALTSQMVLHGADLYGRTVAAQPPLQFGIGAALLAIHDSLDWLRLAVGLIQLGTGVLAAVAVWRLTASRTAMLATPALALLTPWAVHEHGALTPELLVGPLLLGASLLAADSRRASVAGALVAVAPMLKLTFVLPAAVILLVAADRRRAALAALVAVAVEVALCGVLFGSGIWHDIVVAQLHSGRRAIGALAGIWAQGGWNLVGLFTGAGIAVVLRHRLREPRLLWIFVALVGAMLLTLLTNLKQGTGLNVLVPVEASLLPPALAGTVAALRSRPPRLAGVALAGLALVLAQSASLLAYPGHSIPFLRPFSAPAWARTLSGSQIRALAQAARRCPGHVAYGGPPLVALMAHRRPPGNQPDGFLPVHSPTLAPVLAQMRADVPVCP